MARRPAGMRARTPAERQRLYRERKRYLTGTKDILPNGPSRRELVRVLARPREPGPFGIALAAAIELVELAKARRELDYKRRGLWIRARAAIAESMGDDQPQRRAESMLREAIRAQVDEDIEPKDVWSSLPLSAHRAR